MTSMIERVARALEKETERQLGEGGGYAELACAAIEAMRELTPAQQSASEDIVVGYDDFACGDGNVYLGLPGYHDKAQRVWSGLIDAALKETTA